MSKERILFLIRQIGPYHQARFSELAKHTNLTILETRPSSKEYSWKKSTEETDYKVIQLSGQKDSERSSGIISTFTNLKKIFNSGQYSTVVVNGWSDIEAIVALYIFKGKRLLFSDSNKQDAQRTGTKEKIKSLLLQRSHGALVAGVNSKEYLQQLGFKGAIEDGWDVIDNSKFKRTTDYNPNGPILVVARFIEEKNHNSLIKAIADTKALGMHYIFCGDGPLEEEVKKQVKESGLSDCCEFKGFVQEKEMISLYHSASCLLLPSKKDTWGLCVNEAMAAGLPVLVSENCGCTADLVKESNGIIFKSSVPGISEGVRQFVALNNREKQGMGLASEKLISEWGVSRFSRNLMQLVANV